MSNSKPNQQPTETPEVAPILITYTFPDIDHGGSAVTIEATSLEEATALFKKGQATA